MNIIDLPYKKQNILLFNEHLKKIDNILKFYIPKVYTESKYYAVLFELRCMDEILPIVKNHLYFLNQKSNTKWGLQIFHGLNNEKFIKDLLKEIEDIEYVNLGIENFDSIWEHTKYFKSLDFWNKIKGDKIFFFQTDSLLLRFGIDEFLKYDYIGGPWLKPKDGCYVGNGGLSLRKKSKMIEILQKYPNDETNWEDIYFSIHMKNENIADIETAKRFSVEDTYFENPLGLHKPHKIKSELLEKLLLKNVSEYSL